MMCVSCNSENSTIDMREFVKISYPANYPKFMEDHKEQFDRLDAKAKEMGLI